VIAGVRQTRVTERVSDDAPVDPDDMRFGGWLPDTDDHATQGCMLALASTAWGPDCKIELSIAADGSATIFVKNEKYNSILYCRTHSTLGPALAAVILGAPAPSEGP
jgi:hypothetical protein